MNNIYNFLTNVIDKGLKIDTVYDIGAWQGGWSKRLNTNLLKDSEFVLFEANPAYKAELDKLPYKCFNVLLSNPGREYVEFFNGTNTGDSYYKETTKYYDKQTSIKLPCVTLDSLIEQHNLTIPQFIKIDTQGSELDILSGATKILKQVDLIYTECPIVRYNHGAPNIQDYLDFFREQGFLPVDLLELHHMEHTLLQVDIMFMRRETKERLLGKNEFVRPWIA